MPFRQTHSFRGGVVLLLLIAAAATWFAWANPIITDDNLFNSWDIYDSYTTVEWINWDLTDASVNTSGTGTVTLPQTTGEFGWISTALIALRPGGTSLVLIAPAEAEGGQPPQARQLLGFIGDGMQMRPFAPWTDPDWGASRSVAWTGDGGHLVVAQEGAIRIFAPDPDMKLRQIATVAAEASAVAGADGRNFWALVGQEVRFYAWTGEDYREIPSRRVSRLTNPVSLSAHPERGDLLVLDEEGVHYYATDGIEQRLVPQYSTTVAGAVSVALVQGGYWILTSDPNTGDINRVQYMGLTENGARHIPALDDTLPAEAYGIVPSPWGAMDYMAMTQIGANYRAFDGSQMREDPYRSIAGTWWRHYHAGITRYQSDAQLVSGVWSGKLVRIVHVSMPNLPPQPEGTSIVVQVTANYNHLQPELTVWETVPLNTPHMLQESGWDLAYRILLHTDDDQVSPIIDDIALKHLTVRTQSVGEVSGTKLRVRLVR